MDQIIQLVGALLILMGFVLAQAGVWTLVTAWIIVNRLRGTDAPSSAA